VAAAAFVAASGFAVVPWVSDRAGAGEPPGPRSVASADGPAQARSGSADRQIVRRARPAPVRRARPTRILVVGDSTAEGTGHGLAAWAAERSDQVQVVVAAAPGCGLLRGGVRVFPDGERTVPPGCAQYLAREIPETVRALRPDVVAVMSSWETQDRRWEPGHVLNPLDGEYQLRMADDVGALVTSILDAGARRVALVVEPPTDPYWGVWRSDQEDPRRHEVLHVIMRELARRDPARVGLADVAGWLARTGGMFDHRVRPDGVHWSPDATRLLASDYLGPLLLRLGT
jgi:hypothetical protein